MKHITPFIIFEKKETPPQIDDYVIVYDDRVLWQYREKSNFIIGKIIKIRYIAYNTPEYAIVSGNRIIYFKREDIIEYSKNRKELEYIEDVNKYNL